MKKKLKAYIGDTSNKNLLKKILMTPKKNKRFINGIVNNAGIRLRKKFLKTSMTNLENIFKNNFFFCLFFNTIFFKRKFKKII